jgi:hypothetical protein
VKEIACRAKEVALMDLMGRTLAVEGAWEKANLVDGYIVIRSLLSEE